MCLQHLEQSLTNGDCCVVCVFISIVFMYIPVVKHQFGTTKEMLYKDNTFLKNTCEKCYRARHLGTLLVSHLWFSRILVVSFCLLLTGCDVVI